MIWLLVVGGRPEDDRELLDCVEKSVGCRALSCSDWREELRNGEGFTVDWFD